MVNVTTGINGRRALGGDVAPGGTYLVGENGPEYLKMGATGGTVIPNHALAGTTNYFITNQIAGRPERVRAVAQAVRAGSTARGGVDDGAVGSRVARADPRRRVHHRVVHRHLQPCPVARHRAPSLGRDRHLLAGDDDGGARQPDGRFSASNLSGCNIVRWCDLVPPEITVRYAPPGTASTTAGSPAWSRTGSTSTRERRGRRHRPSPASDHLARFAQWTGSARTRHPTAPPPATSSPASPTRCHSISPGVTSRSATTHAPIEFTGNGLDLLHDLCDSEGGAVWWGTADRERRRRTPLHRPFHQGHRLATYDQPGCVSVPATSSSVTRCCRRHACSSSARRRSPALREPGRTGSGCRHRADRHVDCERHRRHSVAELRSPKGDPADNLRVREITVEPIADGSWADDARVADAGPVRSDRRTTCQAATAGDASTGIRQVSPSDAVIRNSFQSAAAWSGFSSSA